MSYWKSKVVPRLKKIFDKSGKKKGAAEACKQFDSSKESLEKEIGEKTTDLNPKVIEIYKSSAIISQKLLKEPNVSSVKGNPDAAQSLLEELAKAEFPGAQVLSDAGGKYGPALLTGPIVYLFEKTSTFLVEEPLPEPTQETREIPIETIIEEKDKEPEGEVSPAEPPPSEPAAPVEASAVPSEEKEEVIPIIEAKKEESIPIVEAKKDEAASIEVKKEEVPIPKETKKEVTVIETKKEEVLIPKEDKKQEPAVTKEVKKEAAVLPSEVKKAEAAAAKEVESITSVEETKTKPT